MGDAPFVRSVAGKPKRSAAPAGLLSGVELARLSADGLRREARLRRRRSQFVSTALMVLAVAAVGGAVASGVYVFQHEDEIAAPSEAPTGLAGAVGGAIGSVDGLSRWNVPTSVPSVALSDLTVADVLPDVVRGMAEPLEPVAGMQRYSVDIGDVADLAPSIASRWLTTLAGLPHGPVDDDLLPAPAADELVLALATDGDRVTHLVARSATLSINTTS